jgi:hypothetical protein
MWSTKVALKIECAGIELCRLWRTSLSLHKQTSRAKLCYMRFNFQHIPSLRSHFYAEVPHHWHWFRALVLISDRRLLLHIGHKTLELTFASRSQTLAWLDLTHANLHAGNSCFMLYRKEVTGRMCPASKTTLESRALDDNVGFTGETACYLVEAS